MRNRRPVRLLAALLLLLALSACAPQTAPEGAMRQPIRLYYCDFSAAHGGTLGALAYETADYGEEAPTAEGLLELYFSGPEDGSLTAPFPQGLRCVQASMEDGTLSLLLSEEYDTLSGVYLTLTNACLLQTLLQLPDTERLCIENSGLLSSSAGELLTQEQFVLEDTSVLHPQQAVTLWLPDVDSALLRAERKTLSYETRDELPALALDALFAASDLFPEGTACVEVRVQGGFCTAVLSEEFLGCDAQARTAALAVRGVVATLCDFEEIERVQLDIDGGELKNVSLAEPLAPQDGWYAP